jgi:hypothetical protein
MKFGKKRAEKMNFFFSRYLSAIFEENCEPDVVHSHSPRTCATGIFISSRYLATVRRAMR